jgi:hypothetical protein
MTNCIDTEFGEWQEKGLWKEEQIDMKTIVLKKEKCSRKKGRRE